MSTFTDHTWRTTVTKATVDGRPFRVVRPARPVTDASLHEDWHGAQLSVHKSFARDLAAAWWLAARSPRSLIHLPLRSSGHIDGDGDTRPLDLVLLHHSLSFRPASWRALRARTSTGGSPHTVELPEGSLPAVTDDDHAAVHHREHLDRLHWTVATDTLFITGSRDAFALQASQLRSLVEDSPAFLAERPQGHFCAEINLGNLKFQRHDRSPSAVLHIQICETHR
jgi:hypothetical protein